MEHTVCDFLALFVSGMTNDKGFNMSNREGYFIFFMPGSSGRLFGKIITKLVNNIKSDLTITDYNSAHISTDDFFLYWAGENYDVTRHATEMPTDGTTPVIISHLFPEVGITEFCKTTKKGIILINVDSKYVPKAQLNAVIKNLFPTLDEMLKGNVIVEKDHHFVEAYIRSYLKLTECVLDSTVLTDTDKRDQYLKFIASDVPVGRTTSVFKDFVNNDVVETNQIFRIEYHRMFDKNSTGQYTTLLRLSNWLGVEYNDVVHKIYADYEIGQIKLFEKYCPWFLTGDENETR